MPINFTDEQVARVVFAASLEYDQAKGVPPGQMFGLDYQRKEGAAPLLPGRQPAEEPVFVKPQPNAGEDEEAYKARVADAQKAHEEAVAHSADNAKKFDEEEEARRKEAAENMPGQAAMHFESYEQLPQEERDILVSQVRLARQNPTYGVQAHHSHWLQQHTLLGWKHGPAIDVEKREHPFNDPQNLPPYMRDKWDLLLDVIRLMTGTARTDNKPGYA